MLSERRPGAHLELGRLSAWRWKNGDANRAQGAYKWGPIGNEHRGAGTTAEQSKKH